MSDTHKYDAAKLADLGYGDSGDGATVEMTDQGVRELAAIFEDPDRSVERGIAEIETARID